MTLRRLLALIAGVATSVGCASEPSFVADRAPLPECAEAFSLLLPDDADGAGVACILEAFADGRPAELAVRVTGTEGEEQRQIVRVVGIRTLELISRVDGDWRESGTCRGLALADFPTVFEFSDCHDG